MPQPDAEPQRPSATLRAEHRIIERVLRVLDRLVSRLAEDGVVERDALRQCVEFFRLFADACHHAKEEDLLFPALEHRGIPREGGPIGVMLHEHRVARALTRDMGDALDAIDCNEPDGPRRFETAARQYLELLTNHIAKEDNVLFMIGDRVLTEDDQQSLCSRFCEVGCRTFDGRRREELERLADDLEARWV
jgi:hemerythrin-like domain-containing protein